MTETTTTRTGPLGRKHRRAAAHALARAFDDDAWFDWLLPDPPNRYRALRRFFGASVSDANRAGRLDVAMDGDVMAAVAAWLPPGAYPLTAGRQAAQLAAVASAAPAFPRRIPIALRALNEMERRHTKDEHWYLAALGTDPARWRRGFAGQVLAPVLATADRDGLPCYLETQAERNLAFYGHHGFEVRDEVHVPGCPLPLWTMYRAPQSP